MTVALINVVGDLIFVILLMFLLDFFYQTFDSPEQEIRGRNPVQVRNNMGRIYSLFGSLLYESFLLGQLYGLIKDQRQGLIL